MRRTPGVLHMKLLLQLIHVLANDPGSPVLTENFLSAATSTKMSLFLSNYAQPHVTHKLNFLVESGDFLLLPVNTT